MEHFLIITNQDKDINYLVTKRIAAYIEEAGKQVTLVGDPYDENFGNKIRDAHCAIVLGGDGTIIRAANGLMGLNIPILGVNLGTVGFLAEIEEHHVTQALDRLFRGEYRIEKRMMLEGNIQYHGIEAQIPKGDTGIKGYALNDIVIARKGFSRIIGLGIYVNDELIYRFRGDGVIISTPTGSTAYNLSAGGPLVIPDAYVMVITPICPHSLGLKSIVVSASDTIKVVIDKSTKNMDAEATATFDGNEGIDLGTDDFITIRKAQYDTILIKLSSTGIYEILQSKLRY